MLFFNFYLFSFFTNLKWLLSKTLKWISRVFMKFYYVTNIFIYTFLAMNSSPSKFFWNFHGNAFCFFIFSKWKKYYNLSFDGTFKMYCCALCYSKFRLHKHAAFKLRAVEYAILFFRFFMFVLMRILSKTLWNTIIF